MKDLLKRLTGRHIGAEGSVREVGRKKVGLTWTRSGRTISATCCVKRLGGKKIPLDGHIDEIGLMVTHIDDEGFLRFVTIGGVNPVSFGQRVYFENGTRRDRPEGSRPAGIQMDKLFWISGS